MTMEGDVDIQKMRDYITRIKRDIKGNARALRDLEADYRQRKQELEEERQAIMTRCPHIETQYHPDASGNNDSHEECLTCGKMAKRL